MVILNLQKPGKVYTVVISGSNSVDLVYGDSMMAFRTSDLMNANYSETVTQEYSELLNPTGISYPIIITDIIGDDVNIGDEIAAYANNKLVGATRISNLESPVVISAWKGFNQYGISLDGFNVGDDIVLKLYSVDDNKELLVNADLDQSAYGEGVYAVGSIEVLNNESINPNVYTLKPAYPNPFNPTTNISFSVYKDGNMSIMIYDLQGREIAMIHDGFIQAGDYTKVWDATNEPSGIYIVQMSADRFNASQKIVLIK